MPDAPQVITREYGSLDQMNQKIAENSGAGWEVVSTTTMQPRTGCMRFILLGGIGALVFKPKPRWVVTYRKPA